MAPIRFPAWRNYNAARIEANDATMALLIASRFGADTLGSSLALPEAPLAVVYGKIAGIHRMNVTVGRAAELMGSAERHLAFAAIPFVFSIHDALMQAMIQMLRDAGVDYSSPHWTPKYAWRSKVKDIGLARSHGYIEERIGSTITAADAQMFQLANTVRNRIIHHAGHSSAYLEKTYATGWSGGRAAWEALTGRPLVTTADGRLRLGEPEIVATLAVSKRIADQLNHYMHPPCVSRDHWCSVVVEDFRLVNKQRFNQRHARGRPLLGHARTFYSSLNLGQAELEAKANQLYP